METSNTMMAFMTPFKAQRIIAKRIQERRLQLNLTQEGLAQRSAVPLSTLRKAEQQGVISLESFLKLLMVLGMLAPMIESLEVGEKHFTSLDEVIAPTNTLMRRRGRIT